MYPEELDTLLDDCERDIDRYWWELEQGLPVDKWRDSMGELLAYFFMIAVVLGFAKLMGYDKPVITTELRKRTGQRLQTQLEYLANFANEIQQYRDVSGNDFSKKKIWGSRARMYAGSVQGAYWEGALYPLPLGLPIPGDGSSECLMNCRCWWRREEIDTEFDDYDLYWEVGLIEHCPTCYRRNKEWYPIQVRGGKIVSPIPFEIIKKEFTYKHLTGQHNQKSHGNRGVNITWGRGGNGGIFGIKEDFTINGSSFPNMVGSEKLTPTQKTQLKNISKRLLSDYGERFSGSLFIGNPNQAGDLRVGDSNKTFVFTLYNSGNDNVSIPKGVSLTREKSFIRDVTVHEYGHLLHYKKPEIFDAGKKLFDSGVLAMSEYAKTNVNEFIAEAFLAYYRGDKLPKEYSPLINAFESAKKLSSVSLKHLPGQHPQKRHGFRYSKTPTLEQARGLVKAGLWEDYIARARAYSGKGERPIPTRAEFMAAQEHIKNARDEYAKALDAVDKENDALNKKIKRREKLNFLAADRDTKNDHYRDVLKEFYKAEDEGINSFEKRIKFLESKKSVAQDKGDINAVDKLTDELVFVNDKFKRFKAAIHATGEYYNSISEKVEKVPLHPAAKELNRAEAAYRKAIDAHAKEEKKVGYKGIDRGKWELAQRNAIAAAEKYVYGTASARRTAMAYLRNDAIKIRNRFIAENKSGRLVSLKKMESELKELKRKEEEEKNDYAQRGDYYSSVMSKYVQAAYSLEAKINRIKNGDAVDNGLKRRLEETLEAPDGKYSVIKPIVDTPILDKTASSYNTIEQMKAIRENGVESVGFFVGKNTLLERKPIPVKNGDYDLYDGRAYANKDNIMVFSSSGKRTMFHEMGHVIEHRDPAILAESIRFKARRTKGEQKALLSAVMKDPSYTNNERTQEDKFIHPYIGKDYGAAASEVLSMGLEMFFSGDSFRLMNLDPDMFAYIYATVRLGM